MTVNPAGITLAVIEVFQFEALEVRPVDLIINEVRQFDRISFRKSNESFNGTSKDVLERECCQCNDPFKHL